MDSSKKQPEFRHPVRRDGNIFIVALPERLTAFAAIGVKAKIDELLKDGAMSIVFDCQELSYTGLNGYTIVLNTAKELQRRKGRFALCNLPPDLKEVFHYAGQMNLDIPIFDSLDQALAASRIDPQ